VCSFMWLSVRSADVMKSLVLFHEADRCLISNAAWVLVTVDVVGE